MGTPPADCARPNAPESGILQAVLDPEALVQRLEILKHTSVTSKWQRQLQGLHVLLGQ